jgi:uncharacterized protein YlxW (UPF0749 family)
MTVVKSLSAPGTKQPAQQRSAKCTKCPDLKAEVASLKQQNKELKSEIKGYTDTSKKMEQLSVRL